MENCKWCEAEFDPIRKKQRFCKPECRDAYNNNKKMTGIHLAVRIQEQLQGVADAQGVPIDEMANIMLGQMLNPDGKPLTEDEIHGSNPTT